MSTTKRHEDLVNAALPCNLMVLILKLTTTTTKLFAQLLKNAKTKNLRPLHDYLSNNNGHLLQKRPIELYLLRLTFLG